MRSGPPVTHDLVLVGAGHTNMHIVRMFRMNPIPGVRLTLISAFGRATYSGMLPGTLAGLYTPDEMEIDLYRAVEGTGMQLVVAPATGLEASRRRVTFADRPPIRFDVCSIGIGSVPARRDLWSTIPNVLSVKPMATFAARLQQRLTEVSGKSRLSVLVVGAGAAGTELAFCLDAFLKSREVAADLTLVESGDEILSGYLQKTQSLARRELARKNITVSCQTTAGECELQAADIVVWTASAAPPPELAGFDLPKADDGFLAVQKTLRTTSGAPVFVVGDTASIVEQPVPRAGVYAVREGPVLWENLGNWLSNRPLREYRPQSGFLSLLATGDGRAIGQYKGFAGYGRWLWKLKDRIDRRFMKMHQAYDPAAMAPPPAEADVPVMKCRGCGGKVGAGVLSSVLDRLEIGETEHLGLNSPDDAAILNVTDGPANVVSVDFFQAFLSDPYLVGRIAALNSLSDLWAMGAEAVGGLAMVSLPEAAPGIQAETLYQLLSGGLDEFRRAGSELLGGHTIESRDLTVGYTVLGRMPAGQAPFQKSGLAPGDCLILTKPLGTGTLLAALGEKRCRAVWMKPLLSSMLTSNQSAARTARKFPVTAVTDVTGFGLAGHLLEMLNASDCSAELAVEELPLHEGFCELTEAGVTSTLYAANQEAARASGCRIEHSKRAGFHALFDPQTSGGLIIAVSAESASELVAALRESDCPRAAVVGRVTAAAPEGRLWAT